MAQAQLQSSGAKSGLQDGGKCSPKKTGTRVRWWADEKIFTEDADYDLDALRARIQQTTFLVPGVTIRLLDERDPDAIVDESFVHRGGINAVQSGGVKLRGVVE